jgi:hypothetical protein
LARVLVEIAAGQKAVEDNSKGSLHFATALSAQDNVKF